MSHKDLHIASKLWTIFLIVFGVLPVVAQPVASFYAIPLKGCNPLKVDFYNTSTGASTYLWKFGNGNQSTIKDPGAVYNNPGKYTITLIATSSIGKVDSMVLVDYITVFKSPVAKFAATDNKVCHGDSMLFQDQSTKGDGDIISWKWDFGDGGTSSSQHPRYLYTLAGKFDVTMAVEDNNGCQSSFKGLRYATIDKPSTFSFSSNLNNKCKAPLNVTFTPVVKGTGPYQYNWKFGDGGNSTSSSPTHTYNNQGVYTIALQVKDGNGCVDSLKRDNLVTIQPPVADFIANPTVLCLGEKVQFTNSCTPVDTSGKFTWTFGDGSTSNEPNPEYTYKSSGVYSVQLRYDWDGCTSTKTRTAYILVNDYPTGKITPRDTTVCHAPDSLLYRMVGTGIGSSSWEVNSNFAGNSANSRFNFSIAANGTYLIVGTPFSASGCRGKSDTIKVVVRGPLASIKLDSTQGCIPYKIKAQFSATGDAPIKSYSWQGLGYSGTDTNGVLIKSTFGKSPIMLTVVDANGCEDKTSRIVNGGLRIEPVFETIKKICRNEPFWIYNKTTIKDPDTVIFKYAWDGRDTIDFLPVDSLRTKLRDTPDFVGYYSFLAISRGCTTAIDSNKRPKVKILGPKLEAGIQMLCDSDSFTATNTSTHYTRTFWRYINPIPLTIIDPSSTLKRKISETQDLWVFAYNDTANCRDSLPFALKMDPTPAAFTGTFNCSNGQYSATNNYPGLKDSNFTWTITHKSTQNTITKLVRNLKVILTDPGDYDIKLTVNNPAFTCTLPAFASQKVFGKPKGIPTVSIDRNTCYPVKMTLTDPAYDKWLQANWSVETLKIKDSVKTINLDFIGNTNIIWAYLNKTDSNNCNYIDTFRFEIHGLKADFVYSQSGGVCEDAVVSFTPQLIDPDRAAIEYKWTFGTKTSNKATDTIHVKGRKIIPVKLYVKNIYGCESTMEKTIEVNNGSPTAFFTVSDSTIACPPLNVNFTDQSDGNKTVIVSRFWDFGDSTYSDKVNPGKLYIIPGRYSVSLAVVNSLGCTDTFKIPELVVVKGPYGTYAFDKKSGCSPLEVKLNTNIKGQVKKLEFDMGDGTVLDAGINTHKYLRPGAYIPLLIVVDSNGCKFSPQPKDTIHVHPVPIADFSNRPVCDNQIYDFGHQSTVSGDKLTEVFWKLNGDTAGFGNTVRINFYGLKRHNLFHRVTTSHGCVDSIEKKILVFGIDPQLTSNKSEYCLGEQAFIEHKSTADTTIVLRSLWLNGKLSPDVDKVPVITTTRGKIPAVLIVTDALGCTDTIKRDVFLKVGDTLPPPPLTIYRSSVVDDFTTETKFNASVEVDFKKYNLYVWVNNAWQLKTSTEDVADTNLWVVGLNTLANSYCHKITQVNYCGMETDSIKVIPHCTVEVKAKGDTNVSRVNWLPYSGWGAVEKYRIYRKDKGANLFMLLDSVDGNTTNYIDTAIYCYVAYEYKIEAIEKNGNLQNSWSDTAGAKPIHYLPLPAPEVWVTTVVDNAYTHTDWVNVKPHKYALDHFTLWKKDGTSWNIWKDGISPSTFAMDDYATNVQRQSYEYRVTSTDVCGTQSMPSNVGRSILLNVTIGGDNGDALVDWSPYIYWNEGVDEYIVERSVSGSAFNEIGRVDGDEYTFVDNTLPKYCAKDFVYRVTATRNQPVQADSSFDVRSVSNYDTMLPEIRFFIPNAFTPNSDQLNEGFRPQGLFYFRYEMKIYNRWGQKVYEGDDCLNAWNGMYDGEQAPDEVYAYYIKVWDLRNRLYVFNGTVHLLR